MNLWKCRAVENMENQTAVSHVSHRAWKSQRARFPHFHRSDGCFFFTNENKHARLVPCGHSPESLARIRPGRL